MGWPRDDRPEDPRDPRGLSPHGHDSFPEQGRPAHGAGRQRTRPGRNRYLPERGLFSRSPFSTPESELRKMSGREIAVAAGLMIIAIGAISEADHQNPPSPRPVAIFRPAPAHTVVIHPTVTHVVTRVVSGSPLNGVEIMLIVIVGLIIAGGTTVALFHRRPE